MSAATWSTRLLALGLAGSVAAPAAASGPPTVHVRAADTSSLSANGQYYPVSARGVAQYMDRLAVEDPEAFRLLEPQARKLARRQKIGWAGVASSLAIATVLGIGGVTFLRHRSTDEFGFTTRRTNLAAVGASAAFFGVSVGFVFVIPGRGRVLDFVNHHNRIRPESQIAYNGR